VSSEDGDGGYVHTPGSVESDATGVGDGDADAPSGATEPEPTGFGSRGWLLVAVVVLSFLLIPLVVYLYPAAAGADSLPFLVGLIALPMLPALVLGLTAVWTMTAATRGGDETADE
jgi:hypothetical protein